jgi:hypothetical protein
MGAPLPPMHAGWTHTLPHSPDEVRFLLRLVREWIDLESERKRSGGEERLWTPGDYLPLYARGYDYIYIRAVAPN